MNNHLIWNFLKILFAYLLYYSGFLPIILKLFLPKGLYVFNYHSFNSFVNDYWKFGSLFISNYGENFGRQLVFFNKHLKGIENFNLKMHLYTEPKYCLTFDDGYKDNFDIALPLIKKHSAPAIFFITTGVIGTNDWLWYDEVRWCYEKVKHKKNKKLSKLKRVCRRKLSELKKMPNADILSKLRNINRNSHENKRLMMDWSEIKKAYECGVIIGSHTHTHPILMNMSSDEQREDIYSSLKAIKNHIGIAPKFFSFPEGTRVSFTKETVNFVKSLNIQYAFTTDKGINKDMSSPCTLKRIGVNSSDPIPLLALKILILTIKNLSNNY